MGGNLAGLDRGAKWRETGGEEARRRRGEEVGR
jgi:hypothetical protein